MALVEIKGLVKSFHNRKSGDVQILRSIDLKLDASRPSAWWGSRDAARLRLERYWPACKAIAEAHFSITGGKYRH